MKTSIPIYHTKGSMYHSREIIGLGIDHKKSLEEMIASGNYGRKTSLISTDRVNINHDLGLKNCDLKLFSFFDELSSSQITDAIRTDNAVCPWEPARIEHLLAFGAHSPREQINGPIIALGTPMELSDGKNFPLLRYLMNERALSVIDESKKWPITYRFLAFRM